MEQKRFHQGGDTSDDLNILLGENGETTVLAKGTACVIAYISR